MLAFVGYDWDMSGRPLVRFSPVFASATAMNRKINVVDLIRIGLALDGVMSVGATYILRFRPIKLGFYTVLKRLQTPFGCGR